MLQLSHARPWMAACLIVCLVGCSSTGKNAVDSDAPSALAPAPPSPEFAALRQLADTAPAARARIDGGDFWLVREAASHDRREEAERLAESSAMRSASSSRESAVQSISESWTRTRSEGGTGVARSEFEELTRVETEALFRGQRVVRSESHRASVDGQWEAVVELAVPWAQVFPDRAIEELVAAGSAEACLRWAHEAGARGDVAAQIACLRRMDDVGATDAQRAEAAEKLLELRQVSAAFIVFEGLRGARDEASRARRLELVERARQMAEADRDAAFELELIQRYGHLSDQWRDAATRSLRERADGPQKLVDDLSDAVRAAERSADRAGFRASALHSIVRSIDRQRVDVSLPEGRHYFWIWVDAESVVSQPQPLLRPLNFGPYDADEPSGAGWLPGNVQLLLIATPTDETPSLFERLAGDEAIELRRLVSEDRESLNERGRLRALVDELSRRLETGDWYATRVTWKQK